MLDSHGMQIHYRKGTKVMVIQAYDGSLYCNVNDKDIYVLEAIPQHEPKSQNFDDDYEQAKPQKRKIPAMNHPWRSKSFWKFVKAQEHNWDKDIPA